MNVQPWDRESVRDILERGGWVSVYSVLHFIDQELDAIAAALTQGGLYEPR